MSDQIRDLYASLLAQAVRSSTVIETPLEAPPPSPPEKNLERAEKDYGEILANFVNHPAATDSKLTSNII